MPSASLIAFLATFASLTFSYLLAGARPLLLPDEKIVFDYPLMIIVFVMSLRHQIRVLVLDSLYLKYCHSIPHWRTEFWLVLIISSLGGLTLTVFFYGQMYVTTLMVIYYVTFLFFSFSVLTKISSAYRSELGAKMSEWQTFPRPITMGYVSLTCDALMMIAWGLVAYNVMYKGVEFTNIEGLVYVALILGGFMLFEYIVSFKMYVNERLIAAKEILF